MSEHLGFNDQNNHGRMIRRALNGLEAGVDDIQDALGTMTRMLNGDGSEAAHFDEVMEKFEFETTAKAKAAWDELNSLNFKLTTNTSITDMSAALTQAFDKFR